MDSIPTSMGAWRRRSIAWKRTTPALPDEANPPARYVGNEGSASRPEYGFCLPDEFAAFSLPPEVREAARSLFAEPGILWHADVNGGSRNGTVSDVSRYHGVEPGEIGPPTRAHISPRRISATVHWAPLGFGPTEVPRNRNRGGP